MIELIKDFYTEKIKSTIENSDEFSMDKTSNEKTPLLHDNEKAAIPQIENPSKGKKILLKKMFICTVIVGNPIFLSSYLSVKKEFQFLILMSPGGNIHF